MKLLSILTPGIPERLEQIGRLTAAIQGFLKGEGQVEHLVFIDNRQRTVGEKRQALLEMAQGLYVAFVDDDDAVTNDYASEILKAIYHRPDVVTFRQVAEIEGVAGEVDFSIKHPDNEAWRPGGVCKRRPWHVCAWKRSIAMRSSFPATNYGEDWAWAAPLQARLTNEEHIDKVLHYYRHSAERTAAPHPASLTK